MITYKMDVVRELAKAGFTPARLRRDKLISEYVLQSLRDMEPVSLHTIGIVCDLLKCEPGDVLVRVDENGLAKDGNYYPPEHVKWRHVG